MYSPFVNPFDTSLDPDGLSNCVFIGFPATESENPFLLPLAAHELGHPVWDSRPQLTPIAERAMNAAKSLTKAPDLSPVQPSARHRTMECFCDALGVRIFGASFLYAAAYLLANHAEDDRDFGYLILHNRVHFLKSAADHFKVSVHDKWEQLTGDPHTLLTYTRHRRDPIDAKVDQAVLSVSTDIFEAVESIATNANVHLPKKEEIEEVQRAFRIGTPANRPASLAAILNAAWNERLAHWPADISLSEADRHRENSELRVLRELVLKTVQMIEFHKLVP